MAEIPTNVTPIIKMILNESVFVLSTLQSSSVSFTVRYSVNVLKINKYSFVHGMVDEMQFTAATYSLIENGKNIVFLLTTLHNVTAESM